MRFPDPWRVDVVNSGSVPYNTIERALESFWRHASEAKYWPVLLVHARTKQIHLAAKGGRLLTRSELVVVCLERMEFAAETRLVQPAWTFPDTEIPAMQRTIERVSALKYWRDELAKLEAQT